MNEGNYRVVQAGVTGEAEAAWLIGLSFSNGIGASTFAVARVEGTGRLYGEALESLWRNYEAENGPVENGRLALANVRYDADILNLFLYTKVRVSVRADIVRFDD